MDWERTTRKEGRRFLPAVLDLALVVQQILRLLGRRTGCGDLEMPAGSTPIPKETHDINGLKQFSLIFKNHHPLALRARPIPVHI